jgi:VanZ family protein
MLKYLYLLSKKQFKVIFFITVAVILYKALTPSFGEPLFYFKNMDKVLHASAFFVLSFLLNRSSSNIHKRIRNILALLGFGVFIEIAQSFTGYRDASIADIFADLVGILLFQLSYSFLKYRQHITTTKYP